jgi:anti-sigma-K factor RskA
VLAAATAAVLATAGTVAVIRLADHPAAVDVTAEADLAPLPLAPRAAHGDARVLAGHQLRLDVTDLPNTTGYYQVWLMNPDDLTQMVPVGILGSGPDSVLPISPTTDLNRYRLIDISAQPYGGNGTHSGKSLLRGTLS